MELRLLIGFLWIWSALCITCSEPDAQDQTVTTEEYSVTSMLLTSNVILEIGPVSGDYYLWGFTTPDMSTVSPYIRRLTSDLTEVYSLKYSLSAAAYGFQVDSTETYAYAYFIDSSVAHISVINTGDGSISLSYSNSNLLCTESNNCDLSLSTVDGTLFFSAMPLTGTGNIICRLIVGDANFEWIEYTALINSYSIVAIDANSVYFVTIEDSSDDVFLIKGDYTDSNFEIFNTHIPCSSSPWSLGSSLSFLSSDDTIIYSFVIYEDIGFFFGLDSTSGSLSTQQYKTATGFAASFVTLFQEVGTSVYIGVLGSSTYIYVYDTSLASFQSYYEMTNTDILMYGWKIDDIYFYSYGAIFDGASSYYYYFNKGRYSNIDYFTSISTVSITMDVIASSDPYEIVASSATVMSITSRTVSNPTDPTYTTGFLNFMQTTNSEISFYEDPITVSEIVPYGSSTSYDVILTCTTTGATSITYSIVDADLVAGPAWLTIDEVGQILMFNSPDVADMGTYTYYIYSTWSGGSSMTEVSFEVGVGSSSESGGSVSETPFVYLTHSSVTIAIIIIILVGLIAKVSIVSLWMTINQLAMFVVLPLVGAHVPVDILSYLKTFNYALFNFDFSNDHYDYFMWGNRSDYEMDIGLNSSCNLGNIDKILLIYALIMIIILLVFPIYCIFKKKRKDPNPSSPYFILTTSIFTQFFIQTYLMVGLSSIYEVYLMDFNTMKKLISFTVSVVILIVQLVFVFFWFLYLNKSLKQTFEHSKSYFRVLIFGSKSSKFSRHLTTIILSRLLLSSIWIVLTKDLSKTIKTSGYIVLQLIVGLFIWIVRPYQTSSNNLQEIVNFGLYIVASAWLIIGDDMIDWSDTYMTAFMATVSLNFVFIATVQIFIGLKTLTWKIKSKKKNVKIEVINEISKSRAKNPMEDLMKKRSNHSKIASTDITNRSIYMHEESKIESQEPNESFQRKFSMIKY